MSQETDDIRRARGRARPTQHISSIAHLFFDSDDDQETQKSESLTRQILVMGSGRDTCAPFTAAGLGHHLLDQSSKIQGRGATGTALPVRQVFLGEPFPVCFSTLSHLQANTYRLPLAEESGPWAEPETVAGAVLRLFPGKVPSEDFSGGQIQGKYFIRHLDMPREAELQALETQDLAGSRTFLSAGGVDALLWCVRGQCAASYVMTASLGRFLRLVQPREIHLLVYDGQGQMTQPSPVSLTESQIRQKSLGMLNYVVNDIPVEFRFMADSGEERNIQLGALARHLAAFTNL